MRAPGAVVIAEPIHDACARWLAERWPVETLDPSSSPTDDALRSAAALIVRSYTRVDNALLDRAPDLRVVGRAGVGLDSIDLSACAARGVRVVHTPDANTRAVVEYVVALMLDATRPRPAVLSSMGAEAWAALRSASRAAHELGELTLGVVGLGRIGGAVARTAGPLMRRVVYHDVRAIELADEHGAERAELDALLREADVVSVHVDDRPANRGFLDAGRLGLLREDAVLINTSRGFVIDPRALADAMCARPSARALLDVHEPEPPGEGCPLIGLSNVTLLPHLGGATTRAHEAMSWVVRDVDRVLRGAAPEHPAPSSYDRA